MHVHCARLQLVLHTIPGWFWTQTQLGLFSKTQRRSSKPLRVLHLHAVWRQSVFNLGRDLNWRTVSRLRTERKGETRTAATLQEQGLFLSLVVDSLLPHFIFHPLLELPRFDVRSMPLWPAEIRDSTAECWHIILIGGAFFSSFFLTSILSLLPFSLSTFTSLDTGSQNLHNLRSCVSTSIFNFFSSIFYMCAIHFVFVRPF